MRKEPKISIFQSSSRMRDLSILRRNLEDPLGTHILRIIGVKNAEIYKFDGLKVDLF